MNKIQFYLWLLLFYSYGSLLNVVSFSYHFSSLEYKALKDLYSSTGGTYWSWHIDYDIYGIPWDFTENLTNPCIELWQGIECDCRYTYVINELHENISQGSLYPHPNDQKSLLFNQENYIPYGYSGFYYDDSLEEEVDHNNNTSIECKITKLLLINYNLTGSLPNSLIHLKELTHLRLDWNSLTGSLFIPDFFDAFVHLIVINVGHNHLTGSLPLQLFTSNYSSINLQHNLFSGSLSSNIHISSSLVTLELQYNLFTGELPPNFFDSCQHLKTFSIRRNQIQGSLPDQLSNCIKLQSIDIVDNLFIGTIPPIYRQLSQLQVFLGSYNQFYGLFPLSLLNQYNQQLKLLEFDGNQLTGSLSSEVNQLTQLTFLMIGGNLFTGTIPLEITSLHSLVCLNLSYNNFHGSLSNEFGRLNHMIFFFVNHNHFTGSIPISISTNWTSLKAIDGNHNHFTGSLPNLYQNTLLDYYAFDNNYFQGTIPQQLYQLLHLNDIFLHDNYLSGSIFQPSFSLPFNVFINIDLSKNFLTGSLPWDIFSKSNQSLKTFVATSNCFHGLLLSSLCHAKALKVLVLNGMNTACGYSKLNPPQSSMFPNCLLQLPNLHTLLLSGNGYHGSISNETIPSLSLQEISLSHNQLTGHIPFHWQIRNWKLFDLSYNKLSGTILSQIQINPQTTALKLSRNHLSGNIPLHSFQDLQQVDILEGNIFTCDYEGSTLPPNDPYINIYSCGTNMLNLQLYIWIGFFVSTISYVFACHYSTFLHYFKDVVSWYSFHPTITIIPIDSRLQPFYSFLSILQLFKTRLLLLTVTIVLILTPTYILLSIYHSTYTYKYAFLLSSAYLTSQLSGYTLFICWILFLLFCSYLVNTLPILTISLHSSLIVNFKSSGFSFISWNDILFFLLIKLCCLLLMFISLVLNALFVYSQVTYSSMIRYLCQIAMACMKIVYSQLFIPYILSQLKYWLTSPLKKQYFEERILIIFQAILAIFTNVIAPFITGAIVDSNCFYNLVIVPPSKVQGQYSFDTCSVWIGNLCTEWITLMKTTIYQPSFQYSYQCSASILSNYLSVYVFMLLMDCFLSPGIKFFFTFICPKQLKHKESNERTKTNETKRLHSLRFRSKEIIIYLSSYFSIFFTFGIMFPPLAILLTYAIYHTFVDMIDIVTTFIQDMNILLNKEQYSSQEQPILHEDTQKISLILKLSTKKIMFVISYVQDLINMISIPFAILMFSWLLLDTVGDSDGWKNAFPSLLLFLFVTLFVHSCIIYFNLLRSFVVNYCCCSAKVIIHMEEANQNKINSPRQISSNSRIHKDIDIESEHYIDGLSQDNLELQETQELKELQEFEEKEKLEETTNEMLGLMMEIFFAFV